MSTIKITLKITINIPKIDKIVDFSPPKTPQNSHLKNTLQVPAHPLAPWPHHHVSCFFTFGTSSRLLPQPRPAHAKLATARALDRESATSTLGGGSAAGGGRIGGGHLVGNQRDFMGFSGGKIWWNFTISW